MFCKCKIDQTVEIVGLCQGMTINSDYKAWTEISVPEVFKIPEQKPDIESIEKVFENVKIISKRIVETPSRKDASGNPLNNWEGTILTGKKLIVEGLLEQKIVYTADELTQSVHSAHFCFPFSAFIVVDKDAADPDEFCIDTCVEDVFIKAISPRKVFKNVTLLLVAKKVQVCPK